MARLSKRVKWIAHYPIMFQGGHLYYRITKDGRENYASIRGATVRRAWWAFYLLEYLKADRVDEIWGAKGIIV